MKKFATFFLPVILLLATVDVRAQSMSDMRLNEILSINTDDFEDDYGNRHGWIELFNNSYGTVDIGGCYLSNDPSDLRKYPIPKGDVLTSIKPRQHIIFWADNQPYRGTFHINFTLEESAEILFVSSDGKTIVDRCKIPALKENQSYGRIIDGAGSYGFGSTDEGWDFMPRTSPSTNNTTLDSDSKSTKMAKADPVGIIMSVTAMSVVFISLILLYLIFRQIGKNAVRMSQKRAQEAGLIPSGALSAEETAGEVFAAVATAIHLYQTDEDAHDIENTVLTINRVTRNYSPWSSKIYTLRNIPEKK